MTCSMCTLLKLTASVFEHDSRPDIINDLVTISYAVLKASILIQDQRRLWETDPVRMKWKRYYS
jgi:hypothetical protein